MTRSAGDYEHIAVCEVWTHPDGWELRLSIDGTSLPATTVVRSAAEMRVMVETWRVALLEKGWRLKSPVAFVVQCVEIRCPSSV